MAQLCDEKQNTKAECKSKEIVEKLLDMFYFTVYYINGEADFSKQS